MQSETVKESELCMVNLKYTGKKNVLITLAPITFSVSLFVKINLFKIKKQNMQKKNRKILKIFYLIQYGDPKDTFNPIKRNVQQVMKVDCHTSHQPSYGLRLLIEQKILDQASASFTEQ